MAKGQEDITATLKEKSSQPIDIPNAKRSWSFRPEQMRAREFRRKEEQGTYCSQDGMFMMEFSDAFSFSSKDEEDEEDEMICAKQSSHKDKSLFLEQLIAYENDVQFLYELFKQSSKTNHHPLKGSLPTETDYKLISFSPMNAKQVVPIEEGSQLSTSEMELKFSAY